MYIYILFTSAPFFSILTFYGSYLRRFLQSNLQNKNLTAINGFKPAFVIVYFISLLQLGSIWSTSIEFHFNAKIKINVIVFVGGDEYPLKKGIKMF